MQHPHFDHALPFWADSNATYFITICAQVRGRNHFCKPGLGTDALDATRKYHDDRRWFCSLIVLMPDHVHMLVSMSPEHDLSKTVGLWKRWLRKKHEIDWQANFFEHRLRRGDSVDRKGQYVFHNPVRAGLIEKAEDWPWMWMPAAD
jgi:putative transposase